MKQRTQFPWLVFLGVALIAGMVLGFDFGASQTLLVVLLVIGGLAFGTMALWRYASTRATGDEWWQDESFTDWRGY
ncbi:MAG: SoxR reducing system RseC family protein [Anaerolineae bacterium]|nr:SoxR reducing system RseC family protein [Anaerolineae bacterium]